MKATVITDGSVGVYISPLHLRPGPFGHRVADILRSGRLALCVCVECGETWEELPESVPECSAVPKAVV